MLNFLDLHYHAEPDLFERHHTVLSLAESLNKLNGAVVLKSHLGSTVDQAAMAQEMGFPILGSLTLNHVGGGIDRNRVLSALARYKACAERPLLVYFPTIKPAKHSSKLSRNLCHPALETFTLTGESLLENFKLRSCVKEVLALAKDWPLRFATGHSTHEEIDSLIDVLSKYDIDRILVTHPAHPCTDLSYENLKEMSKNERIWFELSALTFTLGYQSDEDFAKCATLPRTLFVSDFGQKQNPDVNEWWTSFNVRFRNQGLDDKTIQKLFIENPLSFLGISQLNWRNL